MLFRSLEQASSQTEELASTASFNPEDLQKEFQDLIEKRFGGHVKVMSMAGEMPFQSHIEEDEAADSKEQEKLKKDILNFQYKPKDIKAYLDRFVIGQDEAKKALSIAVCDHYNHLKSQQNSQTQDLNYQKQNVLLLGPTGVGKTYLVRLVSELIGVPFVKADATRFSEVGYMGANVDDVIRDLVQIAEGDKISAQSGIVYVDEVDKLASKRDHSGRDVSGRGVQFGFLRLLENSDVDLNSSHDIASQFKTLMSFQKKGKADKDLVNTRNILFIFSGAFHGLENIINTRLHKKAIGLHSKKMSLENSEVLKLAEAQDLVEFGFEHEFIGRLPVRVSCDTLNESDLYQILTSTEHSIVNQYVGSFAHYGIQLKFSDVALKLLAKKAFTQKTGARGLTAVFEDLLRPFKFELPSTPLEVLEVSEEMVQNPQGYLHHLISAFQEPRH